MDFECFSFERLMQYYLWLQLLQIISCFSLLLRTILLLLT